MEQQQRPAKRQRVEQQPIFNQRVLDADVPTYIRKMVPNDLPSLVNYKVERKGDKEFLLFYLRLLYLKSCHALHSYDQSSEAEDQRAEQSVIHRWIGQGSAPSWVADIDKLVARLKEMRSGWSCKSCVEYNIGIAGGKVGYQCLIFLCIAVLYSVQKRLLLGKASSRASRFGEGYVDTAIRWAVSKKLFVLNDDDPALWTQMELYRQLFHLAGKWKYADPLDSGCFSFLWVLEDRAADFCVYAMDEETMDGGSGGYAEPAGPELFRCTYDFMDNVSCMVASMEVSLFVMDALNGSFQVERFDRRRTAHFERGMRAWMMGKMSEKVIREYIDEVRIEFIRYEVREGEQWIAMRKNRGIATKKVKWTFQRTRPYCQLTWLMSGHTLLQDGSPKLIYPRPWQVVALKWHAFHYMLGGMNVSLYEECLVRKDQYWDSIQDQVRRGNPFFLEIMGRVFVMMKTACYVCSSIEEAQAAWCHLLQTENLFVYQKKDWNVTLARLKMIMKEWEKDTILVLTNEEEEERGASTHRTGGGTEILLL